MNFGENLRVDCTLEMDLTALRNFCSLDNFNNLLIFKNFGSQTYFGQFGNANYYFIKDWIQLTLPQSNPNITWDENSRIFIIILEGNKIKRNMLFPYKTSGSNILQQSRFIE